MQGRPRAQPSPAKSLSAAAQPLQPAEVSSVRPAKSAASAVKAERPGWRRVSLRNEVPLCALADQAAFDATQFLEGVDAQELAADAPVLFATHAGFCVNEACDDLPSLECAVELEGQILSVRSRYWGFRKVDSLECEAEVCRTVTAACASPPLAAGQYEVRYGNKAYTLKIPSTVDDPCFGTNIGRRIWP